jgi:hypothetical protein
MAGVSGANKPLAKVHRTMRLVFFVDTPRHHGISRCCCTSFDHIRRSRRQQGGSITILEFRRSPTSWKNSRGRLPCGQQGKETETITDFNSSSTLSVHFGLLSPPATMLCPSGQRCLGQKMQKLTTECFNLLQARNFSEL